MNVLKPTLTFLLSLCFSFTYAQQISVNNSFSEQELIENNLIQGCVETSNINSPVNGSVNGFNSFAYFEKASSNFPFENGIMLSTGNPMSGGNTLNNEVLNEGENDWDTDADLEAALGITNTLNATSIEFDFISVSNQISFNYILASEEYFGNFPCEYSDGFAFLIREAGSSDPYTNIAVIPGTSIPVNTNTIHDEIVGFCAASNEEFFEGYNLGDTNYNGRTSVLTATANIVPNTEYHIKIVIADQTDKNYDSAVFIEGNSFNANVDLGEDIQTCASDVTLDGNIDNPQATYTWLFNDIVIPGENQPTLNVNFSGNYTVSIEIPLTNSTCVIEDTVNVQLSSTQSADLISDYELCDDDSADQVETFDLTTKDSEVIAAVPASTYSISYHYTLVDAQNQINPITTPIQNIINPQPIFVRIEDDINGCLAFQSFNLIVNPKPTINQPTPLIVCDDNTADGFTTIDLSQKDDEITGGNFDLAVTYHLTQNDATNGTNAIPLPYVNTNVTETLFVNVRDTITGCSITTTLDLEVLDNPVVNPGPFYMDACDSDHDGFASFDLTEIIDDVIDDLSGVNITFHETQEDADLGVNAIANETNYDNIVIDEQIVFIRVENQSTGCASIVPVEIHTNLLLTGTNLRNFSLCDIGNDGEEAFDLINIEEIIISDLELVLDIDITIDFYTSEEDRDNQVNALDPTQPFEPDETPMFLYLTITSPTCQEIAEIEIIIDPIVEFDPIGTIQVCDNDQDGFTQLDLSDFDALVTNNEPDFSVTYFATQEDAEANSNALPTFYTNVSNPQTFFTRIRYNLSGCADINSFTVQVLPAPETNEPTDIIICDPDQDGISIIDLTAKISEIVPDTSNRIISFHHNQTDANTGLAQITQSTSYPAVTESIYVRVENASTGCFSTENFEVIVNTLPVINSITLYKFCELGDDGFGEFIFSTQDAEILNGQTGKEVFYFETALDAENNTNPIDKDNIYVNITNPQTIFVRVENLTDPSCYSTSSFPIEVGTNPLFNEPTDLFVCDDISNDGVVDFDFNIQIAEITQGHPDIEEVSFHATPQHAENNIDPLPLNFSNTVNPQQIYVRINNGTICESYTSFVLNIIAAPDVNTPQPQVACDDDYDGIVTFDLTLSELDILDVRQDNIEISYHETVEDAFLDANAISDPENYTNLSNPQTVFVRVTNTISDCFVTLPLDLDVNLPPAINPIEEYTICENVDNIINLNEINTSLLQQTANVIVSYHATLADAEDLTNALASDYNYQSSVETLFARVEFSTTRCFYIHEFDLIVNPAPEANQPLDMEACDDDYDGFLTFDFNQQNATILGTQSPSQFTITYHDALSSANQGTEILPADYLAFDEQIIYARIENNTTGCYAVTQFRTIINPLPIVDIDDQVICLNNLPLLVSANTNQTGDTYLWSTNETSPEIEITEVGTYSVTVTTPFGCEATRVFNVTESEMATIEITESIDFSDPNNIIVTISGIGNYVYQLDDEEPQLSNVFENVSLGYHTITIIDLNGCAEVSKEIVVIDAPKFVTPNNDGYFDTWHITGVETLPGTEVFIYDRYGKLITRLTSSSNGWDGTYNGNNMPATDYWFLAKVKKGSISFEVKGHFSLRR